MPFHQSGVPEGPFVRNVIHTIRLGAKHRCEGPIQTLGHETPEIACVVVVCVEPVTIARTWVSPVSRVPIAAVSIELRHISAEHGISVFAPCTVVHHTHTHIRDQMQHLLQGRVKLVVAIIVVRGPRAGVGAFAEGRGGQKLGVVVSCSCANVHVPEQIERRDTLHGTFPDTL